MDARLLYEVSPYGKGRINQAEKQEKMTQQKKQKTNMTEVRPEAFHAMTSFRDALHPLHDLALLDASTSIRQPFSTQHILHIIYICAQEPGQAACQTVRMRHDRKQRSDHDDRQVDGENLLSRPCRLVPPEDHEPRLHHADEKRPKSDPCQSPTKSRHTSLSLPDFVR